MTSPYADIFRRHSRPMEPIATSEAPVLCRLEGLRAVLFDVYGTLFVSGIGEASTASERAAGLVSGVQNAFNEALQSVGVHGSASVDQSVECLFRAIEASHDRCRAQGIDYPEVDIVEIWREVLADLSGRGLVDPAASAGIDLNRLAVEYEARANPCWPMPHLEECLSELRRAGLVLGIVSNAQFYTPGLFEALLGKEVGKWGFSADLQLFSYQYGRAKPGPALFEAAAEALRRREIATAEALYVGNDMLNDIAAAGKLGFRTALFAGDARSLRRREGRAELAGAEPDLVLTDLAQLVECAIMA